MNTLASKKTVWEMYSDINYFDMWAVRDSSDRSFNSPRLFHFAKHEDAAAFRALAEKSNCALNTGQTESSAPSPSGASLDALPLTPNTQTGD